MHFTTEVAKFPPHLRYAVTFERLLCLYVLCLTEYIDFVGILSLIQLLESSLRKELLSSFRHLLKVALVQSSALI